MSIELHKRFLKYRLSYLYKDHYLGSMPCLGVGGRANGCIRAISCWDSASLEEQLNIHAVKVHQANQKTRIHLLL